MVHIQMSLAVSIGVGSCIPNRMPKRILDNLKIQMNSSKGNLCDKTGPSFEQECLHSITFYSLHKTSHGLASKKPSHISVGIWPKEMIKYSYKKVCPLLEKWPGVHHRQNSKGQFHIEVFVNSRRINIFISSLQRTSCILKCKNFLLPFLLFFQIV